MAATFGKQAIVSSWRGLVAIYALGAVATTAHADFQAKVGEYDLNLYGFLRPALSIATGSVSSFGMATGSSSALRWERDNQVAATEAAPHLGVSHPLSARSQLTVGQSRFGIVAKRGAIESRIELDFVDFDRAEAATAIRPRLRVIGASLELSDRLSLFAGQDWDIISAAKPFTYNPVSLYFRGGNTGFIRPQFKLTFRNGERSEVASVAIGAAGLNDADSNASALERGVAPSLGARLNVVQGKLLTLGIATVGAPRRVENASGSVETRPAWLGKMFAEYKPASSIEIHANAFFGVNAQSMGAIQSLGSATYAGSQFEIGGFLTADVHLTSRFDLLVGSGIDHLLVQSEAHAGQLTENWVSRAGLGWEAMGGVRSFCELSVFESRYSWIGLETLHSSAGQLEAGIQVSI